MVSELSADISERRSHRRREHPRAVVDWPVTVITFNATYEGRTTNISRGGALIHLSHQLDLGEHVRLAIEIPECQDAIIAKAEIVREFRLKRGVEQTFTHGIALKFTEISEENLKFFSGNLASEWQEDFSEIGLSPQTSLPQHVEILRRSEKHNHYALWVFPFILLIPIIYLSFISFEEKTKVQQMADQLDKRILIMEEQIENYQNINNSLEYLSEEIKNFEIELSSLKKNLPASETLQSMIVQLNKQSHLIQEIFDEVENYQKPSLDGSNVEQPVQKERYYVVKKGDNLYQISSKTGITIRELKELNSIDSNDPIIPGQKLIIK